jgi:hypothetical protein
MSLSTVDKSLCPVPGVRDIPQSPHLWRRGACSCLNQQLINLCAQYLVYVTYPGALTCGGVKLVQVSIYNLNISECPVPGIRDIPRSPHLWWCRASSCLYLQLMNLCAQYLVYRTSPEPSPVSLSTVDKSLSPVPGIWDVPWCPHLWRRGAIVHVSISSWYTGHTPVPSPVEARGYVHVSI